MTKVAEPKQSPFYFFANIRLPIFQESPYSILYTPYYFMPDLNFKCVHFSYLTIRELYDIMALRQEVFIVEQNCPYLDADGKDPQSWHLMGFDDAKNLVAYTRLLPMGVSYENYASIGRVVSSKSVRGQGAGKIIMQESINQMRIIFPNEPVKISAQSYLLRFYESLGFQSTGESYLEDDIPHTSMILKEQ